MEEKCVRVEALPPRGYSQGDIVKSEWNWMEWTVVGGGERTTQIQVLSLLW